MDTGCLSSMNITGATQVRSFVGQLHTQRCFTSSSVQALKSSSPTSFGLTSLGSRNRGKKLCRGLAALQVKILSLFVKNKVFFLFYPPISFFVYFFLYFSQVVSQDFPRPPLENTINYLEAGQLSSSFRSSERPSKPLQVVIAGAGLM
jgi:15-cis-phytoene desaturase